MLVAMETRGQVGFIPLPGGEISVVGRSPQPVSVAFDRQAKVTINILSKQTIGVIDKTDDSKP